MTNRDILEGFTESLLVEKHASTATRDSYKHEMSCFFSYLDENGLDYSTITTSQIKDFLLYRAKGPDKDHPLSSTTMSKVNTVLRLFFRFLQDEQIRDDDPTELIPKNREPKKLPETIDYDSITKILDCIDVSDDIGYRDRTMFELIYSCGLRVSECAGLKLSNFFRTEKRLVVRGKGSKERMIPVGDVAIGYLDFYLTVTRNNLLNKQKSPFIFVGRGGTSITREEIWQRLQVYCEKAGVHSKVHTLRHSFATHLLQNGADLRSVQELLGHSDIRTTEIYTHVNTDDLLRTFQNCHPDEIKKQSK